MNQTINLNLNGRELDFADNESRQLRLVGDNDGYFISFAFQNEEEKPLAVFARFQKGEDEYTDKLLDENGKCEIPLTVLKGGFFNVGLYSDGFATKTVKIFVYGSVLEKAGIELEEPEPSQVEQLIEVVNGVTGIDEAYLDESGNLMLRLTNGEICNLGCVKGEKGDTGEKGEKGDSCETLQSSVRFDTAQTLSDEQKAQARENIGIQSSVADYSSSFVFGEDDIETNGCMCFVEGDIACESDGKTTKIKGNLILFEQWLYGGSKVLFRLKVGNENAPLPNIYSPSVSKSFSIIPSDGTAVFTDSWFTKAECFSSYHPTSVFTVKVKCEYKADDGIIEFTVVSGQNESGSDIFSVLDDWGDIWFNFDISYPV